MPGSPADSVDVRSWGTCAWAGGVRGGRPVAGGVGRGADGQYGAVGPGGGSGPPGRLSTRAAYVAALVDSLAENAKGAPWWTGQGQRGVSRVPDGPL